MITICVPIYGVEKYIERCAVSLFSQTFEDIEYIFVNDYTKDDSIKILRRVIDRFPKRRAQVHIIEHEENRGLAATRNTGIKNANGDFVICVDSDDYVEINMVSIMVGKQRESNADIIICGHIEHRNDGDRQYLPPRNIPTEEYKHAIVSQRVMYNIWGKMLRRKLYTENEIYAIEGLNNGEDLQVSAKLAYYATSIASVDQCLYHYDTTNNGSYTNKKTIKLHEQTWKSFEVVKRFFADKQGFSIDILVAEYNMIVKDFWIYAKFNGQDFYYNDAMIKLKRINGKGFRNIGLINQSILTIAPYKIVLRWYICGLSYVNSLKYKLKNNIKFKNILT